MARLYAGTSGFAYPSWKPAFYPADLPAKKFLQHYAGRLNCVEVNYTFRRLPAAKTLESWVNDSPAGFLFAPKAHMRITHVQKLKNASEFTEMFLRAIDPLRVVGRLGPILFQLPPTFRADTEVLAGFIATLPRDLRYAFEFRHTSWLAEPVYKVLRENNVSLCVAESEELQVPEVVTAGFVYYRLRKTEYTAKERQAIGEHAKCLLAEGKDLFYFFKHEDTPQGALYAEELLARF